MKRILLFLTCFLAVCGMAKAGEASITFTDKYTSNTVVDGTTISINDDINLVFAKGSGATAPQFYSTGTPAVRCYAKNTLSVSSSAGNITKVVFTWGGTKSAGLTPNVGTLSETEWTGDASSIVFTVGASGQQHITSIAVTYDGEGGNTGGGTTDPEPGPGTDPVDPTPGGNTTSYTIIFDDNNSDASTDVTSNTLLEYITEGKEYVESASNISKVYKATTGIKFGSSSAVGNITLNLSDPGKVKASKLIISAKGYSDTKATTLTVNEIPVNLNGTTLEDYEITLDGTILEKISLTTSSASTLDKRCYVKSISVICEEEEEPNPDKTDVTLSFPQETYSVAYGTSFNKPALTVNPEEAATEVVYKSSNEKVATVTDDGEVTIILPGETTITASITNNEIYNNKSVSYILNVTLEGELSVSDALELINKGYNGQATVTGIITEITEMSVEGKVEKAYGNATYIIKDKESDEAGLTVYRGYWMDGEKFTTGDEIEVGGTVTVEGELINYNNTTPEFTTGSKVIAYVAPEIAPEWNISGRSEEHIVKFEGNNLLVYNFSEKDLNENNEFNCLTYPLTVSHQKEGVEVYYKVESTSKKNVKALSDDSSVDLLKGYTRVENNIVDLPVDNETTVNDETPVKYGHGTLTLVYKEGEEVSEPTVINYSLSSDNDGSVATGVEFIGAETGESVYFNLQGQRVANPDKGIYIKVTGNKAQKVIL